jgi:hypothetical protein
VGVKVERYDPVLKIKGRGTVLEGHNSLLHRNVARLKIEERIQGTLTLLSGLTRVGLIGSAVGVNDEMESRPVYLQIAQQKARTQEAEDAEPSPHAFDLNIGRHAGRLKPVNDQATRIGLQIEQMPVEVGDLDTSTCGLFQLFYQSFPY